MADAGDNSRAMLPMHPAAAAQQQRRQKWEVEFARYFATPRRGASTPLPPGLRHVSGGKLHHHGTWLPATFSAALCISRPSHPSAVPVLTVSIGDVVFEEHFVSVLNFSWPQVTCVTQCPIRGSRVVFVSFCDKSKQIQKFALRFPQLSDAESFLNCVKECSSGTLDIIPSGSDYVCEDSSASEYIASNGLHHRPDDTSSFEEPASDHRTEAPALCYHEEPEQPVLEPLIPSGSDYVCEDSSASEYIASNGLHHRPDDTSSFEEPASDHRTEAPALCYHEEPEQPILEPLIDTNIDNIYSGFPPSFTEMLTNCSTKNEKGAEKPDPLTRTDNGPEEVYVLGTSHEVAVASKEIDASKETGDIMARIKSYMADGSFHDMLFKLEKVIDELGGDLSL